MLRLKIDAPFDRIVKLFARFQKQLDGLRVRHAPEIGRGDVLKTLDEPLVDKLVEEFQLFRSVFEDIANDIFEHGLRQLHIILKIRKSDLRFDHPELRCMSLGVGVLRPESRTKGIDISESHRKSTEGFMPE